MTKYDVLTLILSALASISTIASFITCYQTRRTTRPQIKVHVIKKAKSNVFYSNQTLSLAVFVVAFFNTSSVSGVVNDVIIKYKNKKYSCSNNFTEYKNLPTIELIDDNKNKIDFKTFSLTTPLVVDGYSMQRGTLIFPNFLESISEKSINVTVIFSIIGKKINRVVRRVRFVKIEPIVD